MCNTRATEPSEAAPNEADGALLRAALEDAPFEFWVRDIDGRCVVQNAAARRWGDLRGLRVDESPIPPELRTAWEENNRRAYAGELVQNDVEYHVEGRTLYYQCVVVPLRTDGEVRRILGFNLDVTERKRAEEALRESERRLRDALRIGRIGYLEWDLLNNEIRWSPETYRLYGYAPESGFSPTIETTVGMVPEEDRAYVQERLAAVIRGDAAYDIDHRVVRPDGRVIYVHAQGEVMRDAHGRALRMLGTVVDITERRQAEEALRNSEERLKQALKAASAGIWERDLATGEIRWSAESFDLFGLDPKGKQPTFADWQACIHPDDRAGALLAINDAVVGKSPEYRAEFRVRRADGCERWILAIGQVRRAPDGTPLRISGISLDITGRKRAEEELREVDRRRSDFLGVLSHELRNPLAPIRNSLYILDRVEPGSGQARRALAVIDRQVTHLTRLVDDLLDVTRISCGKIRLQIARLDLVDLVRRTVDDHLALLHGRDVTLNVPAGAVWIKGDETRVVQVLGNLLSNAAKFTREGEKISVSLSKAKERAVIEVADTGLGMDRETLERAFVPFEQADRSLDRTRGGLGLGLALVKSLVEMHGGEVNARSEGPGRGACFTVRFPLDEQDTRELEPARRPIAENPRLSVLVIEDNTDAAETLALALELSGNEVAIAFDATAGLAKARELHPDVILCDIGLPGELDGYAVARALREDPTLATARRIALTGYAQPEDKAKAREAGFDAHLAKPVDMVALERLLHEPPLTARSRVIAAGAQPH